MNRNWLMSFRMPRYLRYFICRGWVKWWWWWHILVTLSNRAISLERVRLLRSVCGSNMLWGYHIWLDVYRLTTSRTQLSLKVSRVPMDLLISTLTRG